MISPIFNGPCAYDGCDNQADEIVYNRDKDEVQIYCDYHADLILDQGCPEYTQCCPNCGCYIPIN